MKFANPDILYALFLLFVPIIIHLVKWRRYKTQLFTNVAFLKDLEIKSRKSRQLKDLVILLLRLLILAALILAFAKPYQASLADQQQITDSHNLIYLDNSLSLDAIHQNISLWQEYLNDFKENLPENQEFTLLTNHQTFKSISSQKLRKLLANLDFSPVSTNHNAILKKINFLLGEDTNTQNNVLYASDMQNVFKETLNDSLLQKNTHYYTLVHNQTEMSNISLDSIWQSGADTNNIQFTVKVSANDQNLKSPIIINNQDKIIWRSQLNFKDSLTQHISVNLPANKTINAEIKVIDKGFQFDNHLFFTKSELPKIKVLFIGRTVPKFLKKIYTPDEFVLDSITPKAINTNQLKKYHLVVLQDLALSKTLQTVLRDYVSAYGKLVILPKENVSNHLQDLLNTLNIRTKVKEDTTQVLLNQINFDHPFFKGVFTKKVRNFAYPFVKKHYKFSKKGEWLYQLNDQEPLAQMFERNGQIYVVSADLSHKNTNFTDAASLIVPLFYQMAKFKKKSDQLYYGISQSQNIFVETTTQPDAVLHLKNKSADIIPFQMMQYNGIQFKIDELPDKAGIYDIIYQGKELGKIALNYDRIENTLNFMNWPDLPNLTNISSVKSFMAKQQAFFKQQGLWPWFLGLAFLFLILEMLLLRFWKI